MLKNPPSWVNGQQATTISISDRGLAYGDGVFETILIKGGNPQLLELHLQRLYSSCNKLGIALESRQFEQELSAYLNQAQLGSSDAVLKIIITRGQSGRGYSSQLEQTPNRIFSLHSCPEYPDSLWQTGIKARICQLRLSPNPALAGTKHLNRLEQVLARQEWQDPDVHEGIMLDQTGHVVEGTMTNLFMVCQQRLVTPRLDVAGVRGVMRQYIIATAGRLNIAVEEGLFDLNELAQADEVFFCNSVIGIWPLRDLEQMHWAVGPLTKTLQRECCWQQ